MKHILLPSQNPHQIKKQIENKKLFNGCITDVENQIVWSKYKNMNENNLYWVVPDNYYLTDIDRSDIEQRSKRLCAENCRG